MHVVSRLIENGSGNRLNQVKRLLEERLTRADSTIERLEIGQRIRLTDINEGALKFDIWNIHEVPR